MPQALIRVAIGQANRYLIAAVRPLSAIAPHRFARFGSRLSMNSFELNKILGAILGTCLITLALNIGAGAVFAPHKPDKPGYAIAAKEESGGKEGGAPKEPDQTI